MQHIREVLHAVVAASKFYPPAVQVFGEHPCRGSRALGLQDPHLRWVVVACELVVVIVFIVIVTVTAFIM
jgi:hypothetical protein